jgi:hypothetical protein|tara:strand:- start:475 stop:876 length:402 start_codon:yes stop_codon:yes gene_type:complete
MSAGRYSFTIEQGATLDFELAYKDSDNNPIDLTGYQGRMQLRPSAGSDIKYITLSSSLDPDGTGLNFSGSDGLNPPTSGTIGIFISANSSSQLDFGEAIYDLELATGSLYPIVTRLLEGQIQLSKNVTTGSFV